MHYIEENSNFKASCHRPAFGGVGKWEHKKKCFVRAIRMIRVEGDLEMG